MKKFLITSLLIFFLIGNCFAQSREISRGQFYKTFENRDGSFTQEIHISPIHYKDINGQWQETDCNIDPLTLSVTKAPFKATFPSHFNGKRTFEVEGEVIEFDSDMVDFANVKGKVDKNTISYFAGGITVKYIVTLKGVREEIIVDDVAKVAKIKFNKTHTNPSGKIRLRPSPIYLNEVDEKNIVGRSNTDVTLQPADGIDTVIENSGHGNYGAYARLIVSANEVNIYRSLLKFDVSSIPTNATVTAATLSLYCDDFLDAGINDIYISGRVLVSWVEGTGGSEAVTGAVDWYHREHDTVSWTTAGCASNGNDINLSTEGSNLSIVAGQFNDITVTPLTSLQGWIDGGTANNGWRLHGDETVDGTDNKVRLRTSDWGGAEGDPKLAVTYTTPSVAPSGQVIYY